MVLVWLQLPVPFNFRSPMTGRDWREYLTIFALHLDSELMMLQRKPLHSFTVQRKRWKPSITLGVSLTKNAMAATHWLQSSTASSKYFKFCIQRAQFNNCNQLEEELKEQFIIELYRLTNSTEVSREISRTIWSAIGLWSASAMTHFHSSYSSILN